MDRITVKLIKYFVSILSIIVFLCLLVSSIFLSKFYTGLQYRVLNDQAKDIYSNIQTGTSIGKVDISLNAIILKGNLVYYYGHDRPALISFLNNPDISKLPENGVFTSQLNQKYLYPKPSTSWSNVPGRKYLYSKLPTSWGFIIVFQAYKYSSDYLNLVYILLAVIFFASILLSLVFMSRLGKRFTKPILKLKKASMEISAGNFDADTAVESKDEIEDLSNSIRSMADNLKKRYILQKDFIANVSHDFKTPLSIIRVYSEALRDGMINEADIAESGTTIIEEVDRLTVLVNELMELSKLQSGTFSIIREPLNLKEFIEGTCIKLGSIAKQKGVELSYSLIDVDINADYKNLSRVLYNFIDNAIKFTPAEGVVSVNCTKLESGLKVSVKDTGIGIDENILSDIWNRYFKIKGSGGVGLGLAICGELLKLHGYEFGVVSNLGHGSEFYFIISNMDIIKDNTIDSEA